MNKNLQFSKNSDLTLEVARSLLSEAVQRPWLATLLLRRTQWLTELAQRLRNLSRQTRRLFRRALATSLSAVAVLAAAFLWTSPAQAGTITVDGTTCTLANAITTANSGANTGGCTGGSLGADTIDLQTDVTLTAALPDITTAITIEGNGYTIQRNSGAPDFGVLKVTSAGNLTLKQATISGGVATDGMGGGISNSGTLSVQDSTITGNYSGSYGGGIDTSGAAIIQNSTISGNSTGGFGGGIRAWGYGTLTIQSSTITANSGGIGTGGLWQEWGSTTVKNSIIANQSSGDDCAIYSETITSQGYNIESATSCGFTGAGDQQNKTTTLYLGALADNGGPTQTHALGSGSVAIDRIANGTNGCVSGTSVDQRGAVRADGSNRGGSACDVGAYEANSNQTPTAVKMRDLTASTHSPVGIIATFVTALVASGVGWLKWQRKQS